MISIKDYAMQHGISYEAARQQISRYSGREVDGFRISEHISKVGRTQYLDDDAVDFLNERRSRNPVIVQQEGQSETLERMRGRIDELQTRLLAAQDEYKALLLEKHSIEMREQALITDKQQIDELRAGLEDAERRAEQAEKEKEQAVEREKAAEDARKKAEAEMETAQEAASEQEKRAKDAENAAQEASERADRAEQAALEAEARVEKMSRAGLLARIFGTW